RVDGQPSSQRQWRFLSWLMLFRLKKPTTKIRASKSALNQLARVAALEWGADGIRVNTLHPDAVFDTGIWTDDVIASRAKQYGMSVDEYKTKNILKTEIGSRDVAQLVVELCSPVFAKTTGAQIPIDGGNDRVI
ncbi:MAG: SDR family oxidoreductase, partial [Gammaproteobacteria bacterium]